MSDDYYEILDVSPDASSREIKEAYMRQALIWHPDKNVLNRAEAEFRFLKLSEAYQVLSDPERRQAYDNARLAQSHEQQLLASELAWGNQVHVPDVDWGAFRDPYFIYQEVFGSIDEASYLSVNGISESVEVDGFGNETVVRTVVENGIQTVTVFRNGELVNRTVNSVNQPIER